MSDKVLRTKRISNKGRANVIVALLRAEIDAWLEDIAVLRAEVIAWRQSQAEIRYYERREAVDAARAATDAAGALEDKP